MFKLWLHCWFYDGKPVLCEAVNEHLDGGGGGGGGWEGGKGGRGRRGGGGVLLRTSVSISSIYMTAMFVAR